MKNRKESQFRSQSGRAGFNRNRSQSGGAGFKFGWSGNRSGSRPKSELEKKVEGIERDNQEMKKLMKEMIEKIDKVKVNHFVEEEYELNVRFVDESKGIQMIVDSGAPLSIATSKWM